MPANNKGTAILMCSCTHEFQDKQYGRQLRVHNFAKSHPEKVRGGWRCTVCGHVKTA